MYKKILLKEVKKKNFCAIPDNIFSTPDKNPGEHLPSLSICRLSVIYRKLSHLPEIFSSETTEPVTPNLAGIVFGWSLINFVSQIYLIRRLIENQVEQFQSPWSV